MPSKPLSKGEIAKAKPRDRAYKLADGGGLHLYVSPKGAKLWRMEARFVAPDRDGVVRKAPRLLSFGTYPDVGLDQARAAREVAKAAIRAGKDPRGIKASASPIFAAVGESFGDYADAHIKRMRAEGRAETTISKHKWILEDLAKPLRWRPVGEITPREVLGLLRGLEATGRYETAKRARVFMSMVFRLAVIEGAAQSDPTAALRGALITPKTAHLKARTDPKAFGELLRAIDSYRGDRVRAAMKLNALTALRPGELRQSRWDEIDLREATWVVPMGRAKMRREFKLPLARQSVEILKELRRDGEGKSEFVFPSLRSPTRPMSEATVLAALRAMGFDDHTGHGFRSSFSTLANESGLWSPDAIERQLAHLDSNAVRAAYNRGQFWEERVRLSQWWADEIDRLKRQSEVAELVG
jgi:integrase